MHQGSYLFALTHVVDLHKSFTGTKKFLRPKHLTLLRVLLWRCLYRPCSERLQRYVECFEVAASTKRQVGTQLKLRGCIDVTSASFNTLTASASASAFCSARCMQGGQCNYVAVSHAGEAVNNPSFIQHVEGAVCLIC